MSEVGFIWFCWIVDLLYAPAFYRLNFLLVQDFFRLLALEKGLIEVPQIYADQTRETDDPDWTVLLLSLLFKAGRSG